MESSGTRSCRVRKASGDFLKPDGMPAFPEFNFDLLANDSRVEFRFLRTVSEITNDQIADIDALVLSDARIIADSFDPGGRLALIAQFGAGFNHIDLTAATRNGVADQHAGWGPRWSRYRS
jgi:D-3-phosphoglycerate dehydrogenase